MYLERISWMLLEDVMVFAHQARMPTGETLSLPAVLGILAETSLIVMVCTLSRLLWKLVSAWFRLCALQEAGWPC